jgi:hypothetical protein
VVEFVLQERCLPAAGRVQAATAVQLPRHDHHLSRPLPYHHVASGQASLAALLMSSSGYEPWVDEHQATEIELEDGEPER